MSRNPRSGLRIHLVLIVCVLLVSTITGSVAGAPSISVDDPAIRGATNIETSSDDTYVAGWKPHNVTATVSGDPGEYQACLTMGSSVDEHEIECTPVTVSNTSQTVRFEQSEWPDNMTDSQTVSVNVYNNSSSGTALDTSSTQLTILDQNGNYDDDGVINSEEINEGTDPTEKDTDDDGLNDGLELRRIGSDPTKKHSDNDSLADGVEWNHELDLDPTRADTDGDNLTDDEELNNYGTNATDKDTDGDTLSDWREVNNNKTDPTDPDSDGDGLRDDREINGDTEADDPDTDGDGLEDGQEVLEKPITDPTNPDTDGDGLQDGPEVNKYGTDPLSPDTDGDGVDDATEIERGTNPVDQKFFLLAPMKNPYKTTATVVGTGLLVGIGWWYWRRRRGAETAQPEESATPAAGWNGNPGSENVPDVEPSEPLTDEDHVQQLLTEHGGRMHQSAIVAETGWSKSKVSRLLSRMEDDGQITKISVGRENLITRPGDEPKHAGSSFEN